MGESIVGVQLDASPEFSLCFWPVPIGKETGISQTGVSFAERFVKFQRPGGRRLRLGQSLAGRRISGSASEPGIGGRQTGVSQSIGWVFVDRLLEILDTLLIPCGCGLVCMIAALQVKVISLCIARVGFTQTCFLFAGQPHPQVPGYGICDFLLYGRDVRQRTVVLLTPELLVLSCIHEFSTYRELVASLHDSPSDQSLYSKFMGYLLWLDVTLLVTESRRT